MSRNLDIVWSSSTPATLAAQIIADAQKKAATKDAASKRAAERQQEKLLSKKHS